MNQSFHYMSWEYFHFETLHIRFIESQCSLSIPFYSHLNVPELFDGYCVFGFLKWNLLVLT